jgi:hypothetical protein
LLHAGRHSEAGRAFFNFDANAPENKLRNKRNSFYIQIVASVTEAEQQELRTNGASEVKRGRHIGEILFGKISL